MVSIIVRLPMDVDRSHTLPGPVVTYQLPEAELARYRRQKPSSQSVIPPAPERRSQSQFVMPSRKGVTSVMGDVAEVQIDDGKSYRQELADEKQPRRRRGTVLLLVDETGDCKPLLDAVKRLVEQAATAYKGKRCRFEFGPVK